MNLLVPTYHYFHRDKPSGIKPEDYPFSVSLNQFEIHCSSLLSSGYDLIDPERISDHDQYTDESQRQILVTIDDGHSSIEQAVEIMLKYRLKPVVHIIPDLVGTSNYLDWSALRDLAIKGFSIQSHSMSHSDLTQLSRGDLKTDLELSKKSIEDNVGLPVTMLAAPMGRINRIVVETAIKVGYEVIMTSFTGINRKPADLKYMKRFQVKNGRKQVWKDYFNPYSRVRIVGALKNMAKRVRAYLL